MTTAHTSELTPRKPLRLWPGVVAVVVQWLVMLALPIVVPGSDGLATVAGAAAGVVVLVWWLFFSRAPWLERVGAIVIMAAAVLGTYRIVHLSIANGMMGMMLPVFVIPLFEPRAGGLGRSRPPLVYRASAWVDGGRHPARVRGDDARADRRRERRWGVGPALALDEDA